jgi:hypothetical protein
MRWFFAERLARRLLTSFSRTVLPNPRFASIAPFPDPSPSILEHLPDSLSHQVIQDWLLVWDVARLESAFCNSDWFKRTLSLTSEQCTTLKVDPQQGLRTVKLWLRWALSRNVHLNGIHIDKSLNRTDMLLQEFLAVSGAQVRCIASHISSRNDLLTLLDVADRCPHTEKLTVKQFKFARQSRVESLLFPSNLRHLVWDYDLAALSQQFQGLTHLSLINVRRLSTEGLAAALKHCQHLTELEIRGECQGIPLEVAIPTLKSLTIVSAYLFNDMLSAIGRTCVHLETLWVFRSILFDGPGDFITDVGVRAVLQGCPLLRETDVEYAAGVSDGLRVELARRRTLRTLTAGEWRYASERLLQGVLMVSPHLSEVDFRGRESLTDATLTECAQHCPLVATVRLAVCANVTNGGMRVLVSALRRLRALHIWACVQLGDDTVLAIAERCPLLEELSCPLGVCDAAVVKLAEGCTHLTVLGLAGTHVGDAGLIALATHCVGLTELYLYDCANITMLGVRALAEHCPVLGCIGLPLRLVGPQLLRLKGRRVIYKRASGAGLKVVVQSIRV